MFDDTEAAEPWLPCRAPRWCADIGDRISASIISRRLPYLFKEGHTGMVLTPSLARVRCSYFTDGGTMAKKCGGKGASPDCVPGCFDVQGHANWCKDVRLESQDVYQCAFRTHDLDAMLRHHELRVGIVTYNEVVIDPSDWSSESVEAFFFVKSATGDGEHDARRIHGQFHARYPGAAVPLIRIELRNLDRPFVRVA